MATCVNTKRNAVPLKTVRMGRSAGMAYIKLIERDVENPNLALIQFGKNEQQWVLLNVNLRGA